jgi:hypothetical protein
MSSENIYRPTFYYPRQLLDDLSAMRVKGKVWSRKYPKAQECIDRYNIPHLNGLDISYQLALIDNGLENFGACKICSAKLTLEKYKRNTPYCGMECYKADPDGAKKISEIKTRLYADLAWKTKTESKKTQTCISNHGVPFPMQKQELHDKQQSALGCSKEHRGFRVRGFEPKFIDWCDAVGIDIERDLCKSPRSFKYFDPNKNKVRTYHPDFYIKSLDAFFEVKSTYTISERCSTAREITPKIQSVRSQGETIFVVVMERSGKALFPDQYNTSVPVGFIGQ